jgi:hypothetical protein
MAEDDIAAVTRLFGDCVEAQLATVTTAEGRVTRVVVRDGETPPPTPEGGSVKLAPMSRLFRTEAFGYRSITVERPLRDAAGQGLLLAGVSAGAMVWFEAGLSDALGAGLAPLAGLGLFRGSFCPHYDSEPQRQLALQTAIASGQLPSGLALDDGTAVLLDASGVRALCLTRPHTAAYYLHARQGRCLTRRLSAPA